MANVIRKILEKRVNRDAFDGSKVFAISFTRILDTDPKKTDARTQLIQ
jgi:hypothetical protein